MKTPANWKIIIISAICAIIDIILHALWAPLYSYDFPPSFFIKNGLFAPAAAVLLTVIYLALAIVFISVQENLSGSKISKGLRFGISFGVLWFAAMPGTSIFFGSPMKHELLAGALDGIALVIFGLLLGVFAATDNNHTKPEKSKTVIFPVIVITLFFIIGQYLAFIFIGGDTPYFNIKGTATLIWTLGLGLWIGIMYLLLRQGIKGNSVIYRSFWFGGIVIGINWLFFNFFMILIADLSLLDPLILAGLNILSVIGAVFVFEKFIDKDVNH